LKKFGKEVLSLTVEEAGRRIGLGRGAAYGAARRGELPVIRLGRRIVVPKEALERWLAETRPNLTSDK
jgi:excisionase family DNA binding protein